MRSRSICRTFGWWALGSRAAAGDDAFPRRRPAQARRALPAIVGLAFMAAAGGATTLAVCPAQATTMIAMSLDDLVVASDSAIVAHPVRKTARWESGRIVTYTDLEVDIGVAGAAATGSALRVRTLGGVIDDIGQSVPGEAVLTVGQPVVLFVRPSAVKDAGPSRAFVVTGMSQGLLPIVVDADHKARIGDTALDLNLVGAPKGGPARVALRGRLLEDVIADIRARWASKKVVP